MTGCSKPGDRRAYQGRPLPPGIAETVMAHADLVGANPLLVRGYGLVVGLGQNGSTEVPPALRKYLIQQMLKYNVGSRLAGTGSLKPGRMLDDKDTAVVVVAGYIPPGAPKGARFDIMVEALPQTQTVSLAGGTLMGTELHLAMDSPAALTGKAKSWAICQGDLFVNPFVKPGTRTAGVKLRSARVLNGALVTSERPMRLELRNPDYRIAGLVERRINQRFGGGERVAQAKSPAVVEVRIPPRWRRDHSHYLGLITHLYVAGGGREEDKHARKLAKDILQPNPRVGDIALAWEAMGRQVLPTIQPLYSSKNPAAAFFSSRAGLRLGDPLAVEPMTFIAQQSQSPYQIPAIGDLGRATQFIQPIGALRRLLSSRNDLVRIAAYEALVEQNSSASITRTKVRDQFIVDVVESDRDYAIYATRTGRPKIVMFGRGIVVRRPVFYSPKDALVTINAGESDPAVTVWRKIPRTGGFSDPLTVKPRADALVEMLGALPERQPTGEIKGLGLTYSQVIGVLHDLCTNDHIPARFVLQQPPEMQRINMLTPALGRPDMPDEDEESP